jgi:hypothetical protein
MNKKREALAKYLEVEVSEVDAERYRNDTFSVGRKEYLVLTDDEADKAARVAILESVWAFRPEVLAAHGVPIECSRAFAKADLCELANEGILKLIEDVDHFVDDAIRADGRGRFLSGYDGEEKELNRGEFFAYRTN